jgi:hypothetical protein
MVVKKFIIQTSSQKKEEYRRGAAKRTYSCNPGSPVTAGSRPRNNLIDLRFISDDNQRRFIMICLESEGRRLSVHVCDTRGF